MGASPDWRSLSPTAVHWDSSYFLLHTGPFAGGLCGTGSGARAWKLDTGCQWETKSKWGPRDRAAEPHGQFTWMTSLQVSTSTVSPRGRHRGCQHARVTLVLAWRYWTLCRSSRTDLSGPHKRSKVSGRPCAGGSFCSSTVALRAPLGQLLNFNMDLYET
jgi:hypothetical protein